MENVLYGGSLLLERRKIRGNTFDLWYCKFRGYMFKGFFLCRRRFCSIFVVEKNKPKSRQSEANLSLMVVKKVMLIFALSCIFKMFDRESYCLTRWTSTDSSSTPFVKNPRESKELYLSPQPTKFPGSSKEVRELKHAPMLPVH